MMGPFSDHVINRAKDLSWLAVKPLVDHENRIVLGSVGYPDDQIRKALGYIYNANECRGVIEEKLQSVGIADEVQAIAYMNEIEPKLKRWAESMAELNDLVVKALELRTHTTLLGDVLTEEQRGELLG